ncbi:hypothetical protein [Gordonia sp. DT101]|uniref:hypothetical protein n=1 Tax=Gordonia sp. DT101 TaxID=3416545 RepID=UPI003CF3043F
MDLNTIAPLAPQTADGQLWEPSTSTVVLGYSALLLTATILIGVTASAADCRYTTVTDVAIALHTAPGSGRLSAFALSVEA